MIASTNPTRLLAGVNAGPSLAAHLETFGPLALSAARRGSAIDPLLAELEAAGLTGRGGAGVPAAKKLAFLAQARKTVVVVNAMEGEPAARKDRTLATVAPHLVLDGAQALATALRSSEVYVCVAQDHEGAAQGFATALAVRQDPVPTTLVRPPGRYVAGEESALVHYLDGGEATPTFRATKPSYVKVGGRSALLHNAETMANIALIARFGAAWFRGVGTATAPGTTLVTVSGGVARPGTFEIPFGYQLDQLVRAAGGFTDGCRGFLLGGYGGSFLGPDASATPLAPDALQALGATLGPGIVVALPNAVCPLAETARIARWMAHESAGQCGPCVFGLPAVATDLEHLAFARSSGHDLERLERHLEVVDGRGACRHPDGVVRLVRGALQVFADEAAAHVRNGPCAEARRASVLALPAQPEVLTWR